MKLGNLKIIFLIFYLISLNTFFVYADDKIETVPLINLEDISPTFEEDKDELEKIDDENENLNKAEKTSVLKKNKKK